MTGMTNDNLPEGWLSCTLGDIVDYGKTMKAEPAEIEQNAWILELEDIEKDTSTLLERRTFADRQSKSTKNRFRAGDVLYGKLRPYLNKVIVAGEPGYCTTEIIPLQPNAALEGRYLFYWLKHPVFLDYVENVSHGLNMPRLGTDAGKAAPFILAPLAEQKRIAEKLETVLGRVDACRARLDRVPALLKRFRQSVLAAATSGKLTEEWRNSISTIPDNSQRMASPEEFPPVPESWHWLPLESVCEHVVDCPHSTPKWTTKGHICVRTTNFKPGILNLSHVQFVSEETFHARNERLIPRPGDILYSREGGILGIACIIPPELELCLGQRMMLLRVKAGFEPKFLMHWLNSSAILQRVHDLIGGTASPHLNIRDIRAFPVPLPPCVEQQEIVRRVEALFAFADRIEARLATAQKTVERLTPAVLAKAFRGELVPQDPNDEPASALLERLRREPTPRGTGKAVRSRRSTTAP